MPKRIRSEEQKKKRNAAKYASRRRFRAELVQTLGGQCVICGSTQKLHFDHIDPKTKSFEISTRLKSKTLIRQEVLKCQLLCFPCHIIKTRKESYGLDAPALPYQRKTDRPYTKNRECGTVSKYVRGCRCENCHNAVKLYHSTRYHRLKREKGIPSKRTTTIRTFPNNK